MTIREAVVEGFKSGKTLLGGIAGIITSLTGIISLFLGWLNGLIPFPYITFVKVLIIYLGLLLLVILICRIVITKKKAPEEHILLLEEKVDVPVFSVKQRGRAATIRNVSIGIGSLFIVWGIIIFISERKKCEEMRNELGVRIYKFSLGGSDPFAASISSYLLENISVNSIRVDTVNESIDLNKIRLPADAIPLLGCFGKGLVVYGYREKNESSFYCKIFIKNIQEYISDSIGPVNRIITIQDPSYFQFQFEKQYQIVSKVVLALIFYQQGKYDAAIELLNPVIKDNKLNNDRFVASCYLVMGNSYFRKRDMSTAFECYRKGEQYDRENEYLLNNLAAVAKDSLNEKRFEIVHLSGGFSIGKYDSGEQGWYLENVGNIIAPYKNLIAIDNYGCVYENADGLWDGAIYSKTGVTKIFFNAADSVAAKAQFDKFVLEPHPGNKGYPFDFSML